MINSVGPAPEDIYAVIQSDTTSEFQNQIKNNMKIRNKLSTVKGSEYGLPPFKIETNTVYREFIMKTVVPKYGTKALGNKPIPEFNMDFLSDLKLPNKKKHGSSQKKNVKIENSESQFSKNEKAEQLENFSVLDDEENVPPTDLDGPRMKLLDYFKEKRPLEALQDEDEGGEEDNLETMRRLRAARLQRAGMPIFKYCDKIPNFEQELIKNGIFF